MLSATFGAPSQELFQEYTPDQTFPSRLLASSTNLQTDTADMHSWTYDQVGDVTSVMDQQDLGAGSAATQLQCRGPLCLDDASSSTTAGNHINIHACNGTSAEKVTATPVSGGSELQVLGNCAEASLSSATATATSTHWQPYPRAGRRRRSPASPSGLRGHAWTLA